MGARWYKDKHWACLNTKIFLNKKTKQKMNQILLKPDMKHRGLQ
jgi:hypothetical protein